MAEDSEIELPEIGDVELADIVNELDAWDGTFNLPIGERSLEQVRDEWVDKVMVKYDEAPAYAQAKADAAAEQLKSGLRSVGVDLDDPVQAHAFALGAFSNHQGVLDHLAGEECAHPAHPLFHLAQGGRILALVIHRATA